MTPGCHLGAAECYGREDEGGDVLLHEEPRGFQPLNGLLNGLSTAFHWLKKLAAPIERCCRHALIRLVVSGARRAQGQVEVENL